MKRNPEITEQSELELGRQSELMVSAADVTGLIYPVVADTNLFKSLESIKLFAQVLINGIQGKLKSKSDVLSEMKFWGLDRSEKRLYRLLQLESINISFPWFSFSVEDQGVSASFQDREIPCRTLGQLLRRLLIENEESLQQKKLPNYVRDMLRCCNKSEQSEAGYKVDEHVTFVEIIVAGIRARHPEVLEQQQD